MNKRTINAFVVASLLFGACDHFPHHPHPSEQLRGFTEIGNIQLQGGETAAEISAYDPKTKRITRLARGRDFVLEIILPWQK